MRLPKSKLISACAALQAILPAAVLFSETTVSSPAEFEGALANGGVQFGLLDGAYKMPEARISGELRLIASGSNVSISSDSPLVIEGQFTAIDVTFKPSDWGFELLPGSTLTLESCYFPNWASLPISATDASIILKDCVFFQTPQAISAMGSAVSLEGCEFIAPSVAAGSFVLLQEPSDTRIESKFMGGGGGVTATFPKGAFDLRGSAFANIGGTGIRIHGDAPLDVSSVTFSGLFSGPGLHIIGNGENPLTISDVSATDITLGNGAFLTLANVGDATLSRFDLDGDSGVGMRVTRRVPGSANLTIKDLETNGWETGLLLESYGAGSLNASLDGVDLANGETGARLFGDTLLVSALGESLAIENQKTAIQLDGGAELTLTDATLRQADRGVEVSGGARLKVRSTAFESLREGVFISPDASQVDLGQENDPGQNQFNAPDSRAFAVVNASTQSVQAFGNSWLQAGLAYSGRTAIDDLISDGDADNPLSESDGGPVSFESSSIPDLNSLVWDVNASRNDLAYGIKTFRSFDDFEGQIRSIQNLQLGEGEYRLPALKQKSLSLIGQGPRKTVLSQLGTEAILEAAYSSLNLSSLSVAAPEDARRDYGLLWRGGELYLNNVVIQGGSKSTLKAEPGEGRVRLERVELRGVQEVDDGGAALELIGRTAILDNVSIIELGGRPAFVYDGENSRYLNARNVRTFATEAVPVTNVVLGGDVRLMDSEFRTGGGGGVAIIGDREENSIELSNLNIQGFDTYGLRLPTSSFGSLKLDNVGLAASSDRESIATGLDFPAGASGELQVAGLKTRNARPGARFAGDWAKGRLQGATMILDPQFNSLQGEENAVEVAFPADYGREEVTFAGLDITGFDAAFHVLEAHQSPVVVALGDSTGAGANRFLSNSIGLRVSSPAAKVEVREDRNRAEIGGSGVGVLIEDGSVKIEDARIIRNSTGVIVRGGELDLGGGPLESHGGNLLWPQTGAFSIINESKGIVWALGNGWMDATDLMGTEAEPVRSDRIDPEAGPVITVREIK